MQREDELTNTTAQQNENGNENKNENECSERSDDDADVRPVDNVMDARYLM